ncbi:DNA/RNA non-specific endonuclease [Hymenobacter lucidus]|uniref:DNA/RNA non-specific endonuclease n=1 Tax=Hymenobacter lucidus TaxID=2880930 RepID=A0ABS8AUH4_9BACT|nr:DNA/RNA non-specific endonuclease [Hymenobacter lucidus]MCB2409399.1 DNA/RNA non-specific endonuclease [Hymenobacter lucidus]
MADDADEYVITGALMHCSQGTVPGLFTATPRTTKIMGLVAGNELDKAPLLNIPTFGICQKLTQMAGGTPVPCVPACAAWQKTYPAKVGGAKPLLKMSCAQCSAGQGKVEFMMSGQIPLSLGELQDLNEARQEQDETLEQAEKEKNSVGEASFAEGLIPIWGSGRDLIHAAQTGDKLGVALNAAFLVWDVASVAAGVLSFGTATAGMMAGKAGVRAALKAGTKVAGGLAKKKAAQLMAKAAATKAAFKAGVLATRKKAAKLCARACFAADTPVLTRAGLRPIVNIGIGDEVWAWDEATQAMDWKPVTEVFRTEAEEITELHLADEPAPLRVTPAHWLYAEARGWTAAGDLQSGDQIRRRQGEAVAVVSKRILVQAEPVFNLEVADWHTYFAGPWQVLAHNKCDALTELVDIGAGVLKKRLKPNTTYVRNGYEYATDAYGRIKRAAGELRQSPAARDNYMQRTVGKKDGRQAGDAGGHLIGSQFGGHGNNSNMVAMMHDGVNAYPNGTWGSMEKSWADALADGKKVHVDINPIYKDATARPHSFEIFETIDGVKKQRIINNF